MISKKAWSAVLTLLVVSSSFTGCPAELKLETSIELSRLGRVYTAGHSTGTIRAYYWVDDQLRTISEAGLGLATKAAIVVPTTFGDYVAGARTDFVDPILIERAILWFNGKGEFLDDKPSFAFSAALHDGKGFVAGWRNPDGTGNRPCVWEVSDSRTIADGGFGAAPDIASDGPDLYVCGYYWD